MKAAEITERAKELDSSGATSESDDTEDNVIHEKRARFAIGALALGNIRLVGWLLI